MTQAQVRLQLRPAQIEIAILQTQIFSGERFIGSVELKWQRFRIVKNYDLGRLDLNIAGRKFRVARGFIAQHNFTNRGNHIFPANFLRLRSSFGSVLLVDDNLSDAVAIAQVDESKRTKVPPSRAPAHQRDAL